MATTGTSFLQQLDEKSDRAFSGYFPDAVINDFIKEAFSKVIEIKYLDITTEKNTDELFSLIRTNVSYTPVSNQVNLVTGITDYLHTLALKTKFQFPYNTSITGASQATPVVITINKMTNLRDGDLVLITGVTGNVSVNGERYVRELYKDFGTNSFTYQLFQDEKLTIPISPLGAYIGGGAIKRIIWAWAKKKNSYRKISKLGDATVSNPYFEEGDSNLKILPNTEVCSEIKIDYIIKPPVAINVSDALIDLELTYPLRFLYMIMDYLCKLEGQSTRDVLLQQSASENAQQP